MLFCKVRLLGSSKIFHILQRANRSLRLIVIDILYDFDPIGQAEKGDALFLTATKSDQYAPTLSASLHVGKSLAMAHQERSIPG